MSRQRGFTLLEVMISLTLLSMIMVATISALRAFGNTKTTLQQVTNRVDEVRVVSQFLRNTIGGAMPVLRVGAAGDAFASANNYGTYFWGTSSALVWVSPLVAGAGVGGTFAMRLAHVDEKLELKWQPYKSNLKDLDWAELESRVLLYDVDAFELGYRASYRSEWVQEWPGYLSNPVAVRLNIRSRDKYWPELVVRLGAGEMNLQ